MRGALVVFSHGLESSPYSRKILALYELAEAEGFTASAVDYRGVNDPVDRVRLLSDFCRNLAGDLVLVGSSLGAYVSMAAAPSLHAKGLFLMAPALEHPQLPALNTGPLDCPVTVIHGWHDDVISWEQSARFAKARGATLHLVESDHQLHSALPLIRNLFQYFLIELDLPTPLE